MVSTAHSFGPLDRPESFFVRFSISHPGLSGHLRTHPRLDPRTLALPRAPQSRLASALSLARSSVVPRARALAPSASASAPRRWAGAAYAHLKVKKNNWVEQNEVFRENQFMTWEVLPKNVGWLLLLVGAPLGFRSLYMSELAVRDADAGRPVHERV